MNPAGTKPEHFQVCLTIFEGRHLTWPTINPMIRIEIDKQVKHSSTKESTDCPFYNEYFVFDFYLPFPLFLEKTITISVIHNRGFGRRNKTLGKVQFDVATVWKQTDHQFYHKWAMLLDRKDPSGTVKGYLKCDITAIGRGDVVKVHPPGTEKDDDDIEGNLLVPEGVTAQRQRACYKIYVYRGEIVCEEKDTIDPYVEISFAGLKGQTSTCSNKNIPIWNKVLDFNDSFPPLWQRIKVQIKDSNVLKNNIIATHLLDLPTISSDQDIIGFLPTFGPSFIYLYAAANAPKSGSPRLRADPWVAVLGDGAAYRGRLLLALETEPLDTINNLKGSGKRGVTMHSTQPLPEEENWNIDEILLVGVVWEVSMLDKNLKNNSVHIEISLGSNGNLSQAEFEPPKLETVFEETSVTDSVSLEPPPKNPNFNISSTTTPILPEMRSDNAYCSMTYDDAKPLVYVHSLWPDAKHRIYHSNLLGRLAHRLCVNLSRAKMEEMEDEMLEHMKDVLSSLTSGCVQYLNLTSAKHFHGINANKLDRMRLRLCRNEVENIMNTSKNLEENLSIAMIDGIVIELQKVVKKLNFLIEDPQHSLPDVFVWLLVDQKRTAFYRAVARDFMFSIIPEERGMNCGRLQTLLLKSPAKAGDSFPDESELPAKIDIALWLGRSKHSHMCLKSLPTGYEPFIEFGPHHLCPDDHPLLPKEIPYKEKHTYEFHAYIYQGRLKPGSDNTALCDAFVRIAIAGWNKDSQVQKESLNPIWDETLIVREVVFPGTGAYLKSYPPVIMVEVYDVDKTLLNTKIELVGRGTAKPKVKLRDEIYESPQLQWYELTVGTKLTAGILAAFELLELSETLEAPSLPIPQDTSMKTMVYRLPQEIKPHIVKHRMEVLFWGLRDIKRLKFFVVKKPQVIVECQDQEIHSTVISNASLYPNFTQPLQLFDLVLPKETIYHPPLTFTVKEHLSFGRSKYVGTHIQHSASKFLVMLDTSEQRYIKLKSVKFPEFAVDTETLSSVEQENISVGLEKMPLLQKMSSMGSFNMITRYGKAKMFAKRNMKKLFNRTKRPDGKDEKKGKPRDNQSRKEEKKISVNDEDEENDWWSKYYRTMKLSEEEPYDPLDVLISEIPEYQEHGRRKSRKTTLTIYPSELEVQPEFDGFNDFFQCYEIFRGKTTGDEMLDRENIVGILKGTVKLYQWPPPEGIELVTNSGFDVADGGVLQDMPSNDPVKLLVRVYVVRASGLHSKDLSGKSDPYLSLSLGNTIINDNEHYVPHQLNPIFGRYFEFEAMFPSDYLLTVKIIDNDIAGADDLIGETKIDLENRFYSKHRATCGIANYYYVNGKNKWRDTWKPSEILEQLCRKHKINLPVYSSDRVVLGGTLQVDLADIYSEARVQLQDDADDEYRREILALYALHQWQTVPHIGYHLVPEHVETRSLFHPNKLGIEQGKIELWVDMFPLGELPPPPPIDITPLEAQEYELRVIIWNTEDVILEEVSFVSGEKMSDIYVKGWLLGKEDMQYTDVHYRSLTGEGNFNWRFVYKFNYLSAEDMIVTTKKESVFTAELTEIKSPCRLNLQVFDNDTFSKDDFLGSLILELANMPRGAHTVRKCKLDILDKNSPRINLFKTHRTKGWWPFKATSGKKTLLTGKVEMELDLLSAEDAEKNPVGLGRNAPEPLPPPKRPVTSFLWFKNPFRSLKYILWRNYKWCLLKTLIGALCIIFLVLTIYAFPGYTVKRIMGA